MTPRPMLCVMCLMQAEYPKDFPEPTYAVCKGCYPKWVKRVFPGSLALAWAWIKRRFEW